MTSRRTALIAQYRATRARSLALTAGLSAEDQCVQSMEDASPTKWHLGHTSWFFETVILQPHRNGYAIFDPLFRRLFNSYYEVAGPRHPRPARGQLTRPGLAEVHAYRHHVDQAMESLLLEAEPAVWMAIADEVELGIQHEQQHQELMVTDLLHLFGCNPMLPSWDPPELRAALANGTAADEMSWLQFSGGIVPIGADAASFAFDNERPQHAVLLQPYAIADRLVTCGDYAAFIADGGYRRPELWLSEGWSTVQQAGWQAPAGWLEAGDPRVADRNAGADWCIFGLGGIQAISNSAPVSRLSFYEACAYAAWAGARLPTEFEWEHACRHPGFRQATGHVWQWTRSAYEPYPGFRPLQGFAAEYNGKFMVNQLVLRGGSVATPPGHTRPSYRNFFPAGARWQFTGLRLARDAG